MSRIRRIAIAPMVLCTCSLAAMGATEARVSFVESLAAPLAFPNGGGAIAVAKADFDGDGNLDLAAPYLVQNRGYVAVLLGTGRGTFLGPVSVAVPDQASGQGAYGRGIATRDLDGDGIIDILLASDEHQGLLFYHGRGDGTFDAPRLSALGHRARGVQLGDVSGDGRLDAVSYSASESSVIVGVGTGDGSFTAGATQAVGTNPQDLALADVDGVNGADIVVGSWDGRAVGVLLNDGSGGFSGALSSPENVEIAGLYVADYTGDGKADVLFSGGTDRMGLAPGNGDGTFATLAYDSLVPMESWPKRVYGENVPPDLNGDGNPDAVFGHGANYVSVVLGDGAGGLSTSIWVASPGPRPISTYLDICEIPSVVVGDFDGNGVLDLAAAAGETNSRVGGVSVLLGVAGKAGTFLAPRSFSLSRTLASTTRSAVLSDVNGDERLDLLAITDALDFVPGLGDGTFGTSLTAIGHISGPGEGYSTLRAADFDADDKLDVVFLGGDGVQGGPGPRHLIGYGDGNGSFSVDTVLTAANPSTGGGNVVTAALDGDTSPDLAVWTSSGDIQLYLYGLGGPRTFDRLDATLPLGPLGFYPGTGLVAADFDQDGIQDIVTREGSGAGSSRVLYFRGTGGGAFAEAGYVDASLPEINNFAAADLDSDGDPDILAIGGNEVYVFLGNGNGTFGPQTAYAGGVATTWPATADFDADGELDVAVANSGSTFADGFSVLPGAGAGVLAERIRFAIGHNWAYTALAGDLDADARTDLVVGHSGTGRNYFTVLRNDSGPRADLSLAIGASPNPVDVGQRLTFTATVTNNGPDPATGVALAGTVPRNLRVYELTAERGACSGTASVTCSFDDLDVGGQASVTVVVIPTAVSTTGWFMGAVWSEVADPDTANNGAAASPTVNRHAVRLFGPTNVSPGDTIELGVAWSNTLETRVEDAVVVVALPRAIDYVSSSGGGVYYPERHEVFWKLGDVEQAQQGVLAAKVQARWGLPAHLPLEYFAWFGGTGITDAPINSDEYYGYVPHNMTEQRTLSGSEITTLLGADAALKSLHDAATAQGYRDFGVGTQNTFADSSVDTRLFLLRPADGHLAMITQNGSGSVLESLSADEYQVLDGSGGLGLNAGSLTFSSWGEWSIAHSPSYDGCMRNCLLLNVSLDVIGDLLPKIGKIQALPDCVKCGKSGGNDQFACGKCTTGIAGLVPGAGATLSAGSCYKDCTECEAKGFPADDPQCHWCDAGKQWCGTGFRDLSGDYAVGVWTLDCVDNTYELSPEFSKCSDCLAGEVKWCRDGQCGCVDPHDRKTWWWMTGEVLIAGDPNMKSGPNRDVVAGELLSYTIDYENVGEGTAYDVFIVDELSSELDDSTLELPAGAGASYVAGIRTLFWEVGALPPKGKGSVSFSIQVRADAAAGATIVNAATVFFPSVPEETPTNSVVSTVRAVAALPQELTTGEGTPLAITLSGADPAQRPLSFAIATLPPAGTLTGTPPEVVYTPADGFEGPDSFTFTANNSLTTSEPATVRVSVTPSATVDTAAPEVLRTAPVAGETGVPLWQDNGEPLYQSFGPPVRVFFDEPMDEASVVQTGNFRLSAAGTAVSGIVTYDASLFSAAFTPHLPLAAGTTYVATVSPGLRDTSGNALAQEYAWLFTMAAQATLETSPGALGFCAVESAGGGREAQERSVTVRNTGESGVAITAAALTGSGAAAFSITSDGCSGGSVSGHGECIVSVSYAPAGSAESSATLEIQAAAQTVSVPMTGRTGTGTIALASAAVTVAESGGSATVAVTRTDGGAAALSVAYETSDGSAVAGQDYAASSGTLAFAAGETAKSFSVPLLDDAVEEADETLTARLVDETGGAAVCGSGEATVVIVDDESPSVAAIAAAGSAALLLSIGAAARKRLRRRTALT